MGSLFLVALIIVVVVRVRGSSGHDRNNYSHPGNGNGNTGGTSSGGNTANGNGNLGIGILGSNNNGSLGIMGTMAHNGGQSVQDMHRIGRETCHVTSSLDSIDKNPDIIPQGRSGLSPDSSHVATNSLSLSLYPPFSFSVCILQMATTWTMSGQQRDTIVPMRRLHWRSRTR